ncbi:MAG: Hpt domain-containing protein [Solirubrobacterales bacterium]
MAVVRIEETPDDQQTVNEIFRIAHSMKGMSATMGFARMAALTHQMEDVFELLRQRTGGLPREAIDVLLECLDALEEQVGRIEQSGAEDLEPDALIERLQSLVRERTPSRSTTARAGRCRGGRARSRPRCWRSAAAGASCMSGSRSTTTARCPRCARSWCSTRSASRARSWRRSRRPTRSTRSTAASSRRGWPPRARTPRSTPPRCTSPTSPTPRSSS